MFQMNYNRSFSSNLQINHFNQNIIFTNNILNQNIMNLNFNISPISEIEQIDIIDDITTKDNQINVIKENIIEKSLEDEEFFKNSEMIKNNSIRDNSEIMDNENNNEKFEDENDNERDNEKNDYINKRNKIVIPEIIFKGRNSRMPSQVNNLFFIKFYFYLFYFIFLVKSWS